MLRALFFGAATILAAAGCADLRSAPERAAACPPCAACPRCPGESAPAAARYAPAEFAALPGWANAPMAPALRAFLAGCANLPEASPLRRSCDAARALAADDESAARRFFENEFSPHAVIPAEGAAPGLVTGYYEPILHGSRSRTERNRHPVLGVPEDLVAVDLAALHPELNDLRLRGRIEGRRVVPYWSRAEIEDRTRAGSEDRAPGAGDAAGSGLRAPALAWVEDPVELFFLHIQGSGQIEFASGERIRVGYADQNGHPYRSLGRHLVERGELALEQASMQGIKAWAAANPQGLQAALNINASYVFFRELPAAGGPIGALGVPLSAGSSLAVDPRFVPLGAPVFLATTWPLSAEPLERLMVAQDTGGAIRGPARADVFWGQGAEAGELAGRMRQPGAMWLLWPRGAPLPTPSRGAPAGS
jgi:membrane-bound lytic murein transglycosylase A